MAAFDYLNQNTNGAGSAASTPASTTESTNAQQRTQQLGPIADALASGTTDLLADIAAAITSDIIGGSTGANDNRILISKGTGGRALEASGASADTSGNINTNGGDLTVDDITADDIAAQDINATATLTKGGVNVAVVNQIVQLPTLWLFPEDGTFKVLVKSAFAFTITETTTITTAGTSTVTISINGTPLGGTANSASTGEQSQAHSSANAVVAGDDISITFASTSSDCANLSLNIAGTIVLAAS